MDEVIEILFFGGILLCILIGPWILLWRGSVRRKRERQEDQSHRGDLTHRIYLLEEAVRKLNEGRSVAAAATVAREEVTPEAPPAVAEKAPVAIQPPPIPTPPQEVASAWIRGEVPPAESIVTLRISPVLVGGDTIGMKPGSSRYT